MAAVLGICLDDQFYELHVISHRGHTRIYDPRLVFSRKVSTLFSIANVARVEKIFVFDDKLAKLVFRVIVIGAKIFIVTGQAIRATAVDAALAEFNLQERLEIGVLAKFGGALGPLMD